MIPNKKVIACDLDGTLAKSKSTLSKEMAVVLGKILSNYILAVISGGSFKQFQKQFLSGLKCSNEQLQHLILFPTMGGTCYRFNIKKGDWEQVYNEIIPEADRKRIISAINDVIAQCKLDLSGAYGEIIEDRETQITFSGRGQEAPVEVKRAFDPDRKIRSQMVEMLKQMVPEFDYHVNAFSSIDITNRGVDKAYAIEKLKQLVGVTGDEIIFIGDALFKGGNDAPVKKTDVDYIQESGPEETLEFLRQYL